MDYHGIILGYEWDMINCCLMVVHMNYGYWWFIVMNGGEWLLPSDKL